MAKYNNKAKEDIKFIRQQLDRLTYIPERGTKEYDKWLRNKINECAANESRLYRDEFSYLNKSAIKKRRAEAVAESVNEIAPKYTDIKMDELLIEYFIASVPFFDYYSRSEYTDCAVAIYILEQLRINGTLERARAYLRFDEQVLTMSDLVPEGLVDSSFDLSLIKAMAFLVRFRNDEYTYPYYYTETAAKRPEGTDIYMKNYAEPNDAMSNRQRLDNIILMMPQDALTRSAETLADCFDVLLDKLQLIQTRFLDRAKPFMDKLNSDLKLLELNLPVSKLMFLEINDLQTKIYEYHNRRKYELSCLTGLDPDPSWPEEMSAFCEKELCHCLTIKDPYEILFSVFSQLDMGSSYMWIYSMSNMIVDAAMDLLPWSYAKTDSSIIKEIQESYIRKIERYHYLSNEDSRFLYAKTYASDIMYIPDVEPAEDVYARDGKENYTEKYDANLVQYIYRKTGFIMPRYMGEAQLQIREHDLPYEENDTSTMLFRELLQLATRSISKDPIDTYRLQYEYGIQDIAEPPKTENPVNRTDIDTDALISANSKMRDEIRKLKEVLHDVDRSNIELRNRIAELEAYKKIEHEELASLRELAYNMAGEDEPDVKPVKKISYPYRLKKRTLIVGGHESWLTAMRKMFPDATFVEPGKRIDPNLVVNSELVFVQTNALPHSQFYALTSILQKHRMPLYYFGFSSPEKCAAQLVEKDQM